jgi:hypothetical protein
MAAIAVMICRDGVQGEHFIGHAKRRLTPRFELVGLGHRQEEFRSRVSGRGGIGLNLDHGYPGDQRQFSLAQ